MNSITALLTVYRRPYTLAQQLQALRTQSHPPEAIWCFVQDPSLELSHAIHCYGFDRVIECTPNSFYHFRFAAALAAQTEFVAILDDDAIPGSRWFENCLQTFSRQPGILGTHGARLQSLTDYPRRDRFGWISPSLNTVEVDYVGQSWFSRPEWIRFLFADKLTTGKNGEDIEFSARAWCYAGIRSFCPPHPSEDRSLWGCQNNDFNQDENASSRRENWIAERLQIINAEVAAGWQTVGARTMEGDARYEKFDEE